MDRTMFAVCVAFILSLLSPLTPEAGAQPKQADKKPQQAREIYVIVKVQLYEVDDAFYKKLAKARRLSKEDLAKLEDEAVNPPKKKPSEAQSVFDLLKKQKLLLAGKEISIHPGQEG